MLEVCRKNISRGEVKFEIRDIIIKRVSFEQEEIAEGTLLKRKENLLNISKKIRECAKLVKANIAEDLMKEIDAIAIK